MVRPAPHGYAPAGYVSTFRAILPSERFRHNAGEELGTPVVVTYTFLDEDELPRRRDLPNRVETLDPMTRAEQSGVRAALAEFAAVAGVTFVPVDGHGQLQFYSVTGSDFGGWSYYPEAGGGAIPVVLDTSNDRIRPGTHGYEIALHEVGHALGLKHPHEGRPRLIEALDNQSRTIMSYNYDDTGRGLGSLDKQALDHLYGDPALGRIRAVVAERSNVLTAVGSSRADTLGIWASEVEARLFGGGDTATVGRSGGTVDGSMGDDTLTGGVGTDVLIGGSGADVLDGGGKGHDTLYGGREDDALTARSGSTLDGGLGDDTLAGFRSVMLGGDGADTLTGNESQISGGRGDDTARSSSRGMVHGDQGNDRIDVSGRSEGYGGDGNDVMTAQEALVDGGPGDDRLRGHLSTIRGGDGDDTISASYSTVEGGKGDDLILLPEQNHRFTIVFGEGDGTDSVRVSVVSLPYLAQRIRLTDGDLTGDEVVELFERRGNDLVLDFGDGDALVFKGLGYRADPADLLF